MVLLTVSYLLTLKIKENNVADTQLKLQESNDIIRYIQSYLHVFIILIIILWFLSYLGSKKSEYNKKFSYFTFIFGKGSCANDGSKLTYIKGLMNAFS